MVSNYNYHLAVSMEALNIYFKHINFPNNFLIMRNFAVDLLIKTIINLNNFINRKHYK